MHAIYRYGIDFRDFHQYIGLLSNCLINKSGIQTTDFWECWQKNDKQECSNFIKKNMLQWWNQLCFSKLADWGGPEGQIGHSGDARVHKDNTGHQRIWTWVRQQGKGVWFGSFLGLKDTVGLVWGYHILLTSLIALEFLSDKILEVYFVNFSHFYYTPVFRRDVLWYGDVRPSGSPSDSPSVRLSVRPGLRPPVFHTFLIHALTYWAEILHITLF